MIDDSLGWGRGNPKGREEVSLANYASYSISYCVVPSVVHKMAVMHCYKWNAFVQEATEGMFWEYYSF